MAKVSFRDSLKLAWIRIQERIYNTSSVVTWAIHYFAGAYREAENTAAEPLRNEVVRQRYALGESLSALAREFGLSPACVSQFVNPQIKRYLR